MLRIDQRSKIASDEVDAIVRAHLIDVTALRTADFEVFFVQRREAVLNLVQQAMGKPAARDVDAAGSGTESAAAFVEEDDDHDDVDIDFENPDGSVPD